MPRTQTHNKMIRDGVRTGFVLCLTFAWIGVTGCRQRAYTELYVENMASEVRMLEDRVYEYDAAYQSLEQDVDDLRKTNEELERKYREQKSMSYGSTGNSSRGSTRKLENEPPMIYEKVIPQHLLPSESYEIPSVLVPESIKSNGQIEALPPAVIRSPAPPVYKDKAPARSNPSELESAPTSPNPPAKEVLPGVRDDPRGAMNNIRARQKGALLAPPESLTEQVTLPQSIVRSAQQPKLITAPPQSNDVPPKSEHNPINNVPSSIPSLLPRAFPAFKDEDKQGALQRNRIRMPEGSNVQWASANEPKSKPVVDGLPHEVVDKKILEIAFHPTLCRGHNFDQNPGDDGLYLVITPLNAIGQVVNQTGTLTVIVEDPSISENNGRIAAWELGPKQLQDVLTPIGASQGFHLSLPWQEDLPKSQTVVVYLRYQLDDGRTLVNKREIHLRKPTIGQSIWTPR